MAGSSMEKAVLGALLGLVFWIGVAAGGAAGLVFDRHPTIEWTWPLIPRVFFPASWKHVKLEGMQARLDDAVAAQAKAETARNACAVALTAQNAKVASLTAQSAAATAQAAHDVEAARAVAESVRQAAAALRGYQPQGADRCARWDDADKAVVEGFK